VEQAMIDSMVFKVIKNLVFRLNIIKIKEWRKSFNGIVFDSLVTTIVNEDLVARIDND
jgi:hypothetical protein